MMEKKREAKASRKVVTQIESARSRARAFFRLDKPVAVLVNVRLELPEQSMPKNFTWKSHMARLSFPVRLQMSPALHAPFKTSDRGSNLFCWCSSAANCFCLCKM